MKKLKIVFTLGLLMVFESAFAAGDKVEDVFKNAARLYENECFAQAIEEYLKVVCLYPASDYIQESEYMVGKCLQAQKKYWRAKAQWDRVVKKYPSTQWEQKAAAAIKKVNIIIEDNSRARYAVVELDRGKEQAAIDSLRATSGVLTVEPIYDNLQYPLDLKDKAAYTFIKYGDDCLTKGAKQTAYRVEWEEHFFNKALYWFNRVITDYPDSIMVPYAYDRIANAYYKRDRTEHYKTAVSNYLLAQAKFPNDIPWVLRELRLAADTSRDKLKNKKETRDIYTNLLNLAKEKMGDESFYAGYAQTEIETLK